MRSYKLYIYRHGMTAANLEGRYIGRTDEPLSDAGIAELLTKASEKEYPNIGKLYASPLKRALQSAGALYPGHPIHVVEELREYDFGDYENKTVSELGQDESFFAWVGKQGAAPPHAEDPAAFSKRVLEGINRIILDMMKNGISEAAVVTHGGVLMSILAICGLPRMAPTNWSVAYGEGYSLLINAQLWANTQTFEVCDHLPYEPEEEFESNNYTFYDVDELRREYEEERNGSHERG